MENKAMYVYEVTMSIYDDEDTKSFDTSLTHVVASSMENAVAIIKKVYKRSTIDSIRRIMYLESNLVESSNNNFF